MRPFALSRAFAGIAVILLAATTLPAHAGSLDRFRDVFSGQRYDGFRFGYGAFLGEHHDDRHPPGHLGRWYHPEEPLLGDRAPAPPPQAQPDDTPNELEDRAG